MSPGKRPWRLAVLIERGGTPDRHGRPINPRWAFVAAALVVVGVVVAGFLVLRDDDSRTNSARDFVSQADQICRQSQREFDQVQRRPPRTASQAENQAEALIDVSEDALREL